MAVKPIPDGFRGVTPYLAIDGAAGAIEFYCKVLGATERMRMPDAEGKILHAELQIGDSVVMLSDEFPDMNVAGPKKLGGSPVMLMVYVEDADATQTAAIKAGATEVRPVEDQFYGDRSGQFVDPFGHRWNVATHIEDVSDEEMAKRMQAMGQG